MTLEETIEDAKSFLKSIQGDNTIGALVAREHYTILLAAAEENIKLQYLYKDNVKLTAILDKLQKQNQVYREALGKIMGGYTDKGYYYAYELARQALAEGEK